MNKRTLIAGIVTIIIIVNAAALLTANRPPVPTGGEHISSTTRESYGWWARSYGLENNDSAYIVSHTSDDGYIVAGYVNSTDDMSNENGHMVIMKLNSDGTVAWDKIYEGDGEESAHYIEEVETGYIVSGTTTSFGSAYTDIWILKLAHDGSVEWETRYGGQKGENGYKILPTADGGYIIGGDTLSYGAGNGDLWLIKINSTGSIEWQKVYGGSSYDYFENLITTSDGGYLLMGITQSFGAGGYDIWLLKIDSSGNITWQKTYGSSEYDYGKAIIETSDGYIVLGHTKANGNFDFWVLKIDKDGSVLWQKTYGGSGAEISYDMTATGDGYILMGFTTSWGVGSYDVWLVAINYTGTIEWQRAYGGPQEDICFSLDTISSNGIVVGGETSSFGAGYNDIWVLKTNSTGYIDFDSEPSAKMTETTATVSGYNPVITDTTITGKDTSAVAETTTATVRDEEIHTSTQSNPVTVPELGFVVILMAIIVLAVRRTFKK